MENWKPVPRYPDYEVSTLGTIRRLTPAERTFVGRIVKPSTKGQWGHRSCQLGRGNRVSVHRTVLEAFIGPCPPDMEARHLNGDSSDNRLSNLAWGTKRENTDDKFTHGTVHRKLTLEQVEEIRRRYTGAWGQQTILGKEYGVSQVRISQLVRNHQNQPGNTSTLTLSTSSPPDLGRRGRIRCSTSPSHGHRTALASRCCPSVCPHSPA